MTGTNGEVHRGDGTPGNPTRSPSTLLPYDLAIWGAWTAVVVLLLEGLWVATGATFCLWLCLGYLRLNRAREMQRSALQGLARANELLQGVRDMARARAAAERSQELRGDSPTH